RYLNKCEKNWICWKLCIEEPFNIGRNLGNGVSYDGFKKIKKEFSRPARILYKADLKVCCQTLTTLAESYDEHEYNSDGFNIITNIITTPPDKIYECEYNDDGSLVITSEALKKLQFQKANDVLVRSLRYIVKDCRDKKKVEKAKSISNIKAKRGDDVDNLWLNLNINKRGIMIIVRFFNDDNKEELGRLIDDHILNEKTNLPEFNKINFELEK
ncbi:3609_t:CDS:2, partial [Gigaspora margarita]